MPRSHQGIYGENESTNGGVQFEDSASSPESEAPTLGPYQAAAARAKRIACIICRKRKLRCDGQKPACGTCARLGHRCGYDEVRKKSGPKRGYVKELEARLRVAEEQLRSIQNANITSTADLAMTSGTLNGTFHRDSDTMRNFTSSARMAPLFSGLNVPNLMVTGTTETDYPGEIIHLGLEEALPPQEIIDEL